MLESSAREILIIVVLLGAVVFLVAFTYFYNVQRYGRAAAKLIIPRRTITRPFAWVG